MRTPAIRPVKTYCDGQAAKSRKKPSRPTKFDSPYAQRSRKSDGFHSKVLHVYRLRHSTSEPQLLEIFGGYGSVDEIILYRPQFALIIFSYVQDAVAAKRELDLYATLRDGSYINVLLREVQFCNGEPYASKRPHDKLRVDFAHPVVAQKIKTHPDAALKILANPWGTHEEIDLPGSTSASAAVLNEADDFLDDSVFEEPC
ncbi:hypothetical protein AAVH_29008, partial [Aphelenchoides avenae]